MAKRKGELKRSGKRVEIVASMWRRDGYYAGTIFSRFYRYYSSVMKHRWREKKMSEMSEEAGGLQLDCFQRR